MPHSGTVAQIGPQWDVLEDKDGTLTLDDVRALRTGWSPATQPDPNFGFTRSAYWLRAVLVNTQAESNHWLLGLQYPSLDYIDAYFLHSNGNVRTRHTGDRRPFSTREFESTFYYFDLPISPMEKVEVFLRLESQGPVLVPLVIAHPSEMRRLLIAEYSILWIFSGAILAIFAYNILLFSALKELVYLYYVIYLAIFTISHLTIKGIAYQYFWPNLPELNNFALPFSIGAGGAALIHFGRTFLSLKKFWPSVERISLVLFWVFCASSLLSLVVNYHIAIQLSTALTIFTPLFYIVVTFVLLRRGNKQAQYLLLAFVCLMAGIVLTSLLSFDVVSKNFFTDYGTQIGSFFEITLLSYALAHRLKLAQEANEQLRNAHAHELEERVRQRTAELGTALNQLNAANTQLKALSVRDPLTGLHNRLHLSERLADLWRQAQRWRQSLAVLLVDIDHFKRVNDQYGHATGDHALRLVANTLARCISRPGDVAVRYGGEEFLVLLPHTDTEGASKVAESMRISVEALSLVVDRQRIALTVSIGVSCTTPEPGDRSEDLIAQADQRLYAAKNAGRNRCVAQETSGTNMAA